MKKIILLVCLFGAILKANAQNNKTFDPERAQGIVVDLNAAHFNIDTLVQTGNIVIEINVKGNMPMAVMQQLSKNGRYELKGELNGESYVITAPNIEKNVTFRGKDLEEEITVTIKAPKLFLLAHNTLKIDMSLFTPRCCISPEETKKMYSIKNKLETALVLSSALKSDVQLKIKAGDIIVDGMPLTID